MFLHVNTTFMSDGPRVYIDAMHPLAGRTLYHFPSLSDSERPKAQRGALTKVRPSVLCSASTNSSASLASLMVGRLRAPLVNASVARRPVLLPTPNTLHEAWLG